MGAAKEENDLYVRTDEVEFESSPTKLHNGQNFNEALPLVCASCWKLVNIVVLIMRCLTKLLDFAFNNGI